MVKKRFLKRNIEEEKKVAGGEGGGGDGSGDQLFSAERKLEQQPGEYSEVR